MTRFTRFALVVVCLVPLCLKAAEESEPKGKIVKETWDAVFLEGKRIGYVQTTVRETEESDKKALNVMTEMNLTLKRLKDLISLRMQQGSTETEDGKVTGLFMKHYLGKKQTLTLTGKVIEGGKKIHVLVDGGQRNDKKEPWDDSVIGMVKQENQYRDRKVKPGDKFSYRSFEPTVSTVITTDVEIKDFEEVDVLGQQRKLLKFVAKPEKLKVGGTELNLPALTGWLDKDFNIVRSVVDAPGLGELTLVRSTKDIALAKVDGDLKDIGLAQMVKINKAIRTPHDSVSAVYRIRVKGDDEPQTSFATDSRQTIKNVRGDTFELHINARPENAAKEPKPGKEYLESNDFIKSDDKKVIELANKAVGDEKDDWKKAKKIERWVYQNIKNKNYTEAFATADQVARQLEGDCSEHSVLSAAMCRAVGIPSRTAMGLVYVDPKQLGFHMWTEVYVDGHWLPLDATLGRGQVGACHLKISDHSWANTRSLTPVLPVVRVLGKLTVDVNKVDYK